MTLDIKRYRLRHRARPLDVWVAGGDGTPLVLLHGWGLSGRAYREAMLALADRGYRVVAPGIAVADDWRIERAAEFAAEAMAGVDAAPAPVVGHSFGGVIGAQLTIDHTDFVRALVAVDSPLVSLGSARLGRIMLPGSHYRIVGHGPAAAALLRSATSRSGVESLWRSARWFLGKPKDEVLARVASTGVPRAVVWAENDSLIPVAIGVKAAKLLDCDLTIVHGNNGWPGARPPDHDWPFREPAHFADTVAGILDGLLPDGKVR
ncbi:MAG TPA: alpha/beta fold hydrolase [Actinomycetota bacterium]|nr:alpha/beta fold hydrolase [Actinomycetota bacterium]